MNTCTKSDRLEQPRRGSESLFTLRPHQFISEHHRRILEQAPTDRKYLRAEDTAAHNTSNPQRTGPAHFHADTIRWVCSLADVVLIEAGGIGVDSKAELEAAIAGARWVFLVRTFPQRADAWSRALRPLVRPNAEIFSAVMPVAFTLGLPDADAFESIFSLAYLGEKH